jgi:hypothetical protein
MLKDKLSTLTALQLQEDSPKSLKEFLKSGPGVHALQKSGTDVAVSVQCIAASISSFKTTEAEKNFANDVKTVIESPEFIDNLSAAIGTPLPTESEDEFVARAKSRMADLLWAKFSK